MKRIGDSVYQSKTGFFIRVTLNGSRTWRKLKAIAKKEAKEEAEAKRTDLGRSKVGMAKSPFEVRGNTVKELVALYIGANCPNTRLESRPAAFCKSEESKLAHIVAFMGNRSADALRLPVCIEYKNWRCKRISENRKGDGRRTCELEQVSLSNVLNYAVALGKIDQNMIRHGRPKFQTRDRVRHSREVALQSGDQLHQLAEYFFEDKKSHVFAWQMLFQAFTGCRTSEILLLRTDATSISDPGFIEGGYLWLRRSKKGVHPYSAIGAEFERLIECHLNWLSIRYPKSPWYFPGFSKDGVECVDKNSFGHALSAACKELNLPHMTPHGIRSFYVTKRRSEGLLDAQVAAEIGDKTVALISQTYGDLPPNWKGPNGKPISWFPSEGFPSWLRWQRAELKVVNL